MSLTYIPYAGARGYEFRKCLSLADDVNHVDE